MKSLKLSSMKSLLLATVFTCGMYQPAYAATIDETGAAALKQEMTQAIEDFKLQLALPESAQSGLKVLGDVEVTPQGDYYAVVFPVFEYRVDSDVRFDFGQFKANMKPAGNDDWKYSMLIPPKMRVLNQNGDEMASLKIGEQVNQGIWNSEYGISSKSKVMLKDIVLSTPEGINSIKFSAKIDSFENFTNLERDANNLYSGPQTYKMSNFSVMFDDGKEDGAFQIQEISGDANVEGMSLEVMKNINSLQGMLQEMQAGQMTEADTAAIEAEVANMIRGFGSFIKSGDSSMAIKNVSGRMNDKMGVERSFNLDTMGVSFTADKMDQPKAMIGFDFDISNMVARPVPKEAEPFIPYNMNFNFELRDFPLVEILNFAADNMKNTGPQTGMQMVEILRQAMTELRISNTVFAFGEYEIEVDTQVKPSASGAPVPDMKTTIGIVGLDKLLAEIQAKQQAGTATMQEQQMMGGLAMVQQMGQNATSAKSGKPIRQYVFETQPGGKMFLNGSDIQPMIGMFMGQAMGGAAMQPGM